MMAYDYSSKFRSTDQQANADCLSQLPSVTPIEKEEYVFVVGDNPVANEVLIGASKADRTLIKLRTRCSNNCFLNMVIGITRYINWLYIRV